MDLLLGPGDRVGLLPAPVNGVGVGDDRTDQGERSQPAEPPRGQQDTGTNLDGAIDPHERLRIEWNTPHIVVEGSGHHFDLLDLALRMLHGVPTFDDKDGCEHRTGDSPGECHLLALPIFESPYPSPPLPALSRSRGPGRRDGALGAPAVNHPGWRWPR